MPLSGCQRVETGHGRQGSRGFFFLTLRYHAGVTSRERMDAAMRPAEGLTPDRVPVMCQACSVSPRTPPENILAIARAVEEPACVA